MTAASEPPVAPAQSGSARKPLEGLTIYARERRATSVPTVRIEEPTVGPDPPIPLVVVTRVLRRNSSAALRDCYLRAQVATPTLTGTILTQFLVGEDGTVKTPQVIQGLNAELDACVVAQLKASLLPRPRGGSVSLRYPFNFLLEP